MKTVHDTRAASKCSTYPLTHSSHWRAKTHTHNNNIIDMPPRRGNNDILIKIISYTSETLWRVYYYKNIGSEYCLPESVFR